MPAAKNPAASPTIGAGGEWLAITHAALNAIQSSGMSSNYSYETSPKTRGQSETELLGLLAKIALLAGGGQKMTFDGRLRCLRMD